MNNKRMGQCYQRVIEFIFAGEKKKFIFFILVGGINTVFGYSLYALLLYFGFYYAIASLLGTIGGVLFNFKTTGVIVFKNNNNKLLFRFISVYTVTYLLNVGFLKIFAGFNANMYFAGAVLLIPMALISFIFQKNFVFRRDNHETNKHSNTLF